MRQRVFVTGQHQFLVWVPTFPPLDTWFGGLVTESCPTLVTPWTTASASLLCPWDFSGKNTGVGCHTNPQALAYKILREDLPELDPCILHLWS